MQFVRTQTNKVLFKQNVTNEYYIEAALNPLALLSFSTLSRKKLSCNVFRIVFIV